MSTKKLDRSYQYPNLKVRAKLRANDARSVSGFWQAMFSQESVGCLVQEPKQLG